MVTNQLVKNINNTDLSVIPSEVITHAKKSILNWLGVTIGASYHETIEIALKLKDELDSSEQVSIIGRKERTDVLLAVLINGMASHIYDFDDTYLETIHHPSGPVAPVIFALGEKYNLPGDQLIKAFILGVETELRISRALYPSHYDTGWHITATTGCFGSVVAASILLDLTEEQMVHALGIAGTQAAGLREVFGSMTKPFHPGKAAQNGLLAALLARDGFTSSPQLIEAEKGMANVMSDTPSLHKINEQWGEIWEIRDNAFKPYACGIVLHPVIDACIHLRNFVNIDEIQTVELKVNPYVLEMTGKKEPSSGLEAKFSVYHASAIALLDGDGAQEQFEEAKVIDPEVIKLRQKVKPVPDEKIKEEQAYAKLILKDGREHEVFIEHATGSKQRPMSQNDLNDKFFKLTSKYLGRETINGLIDDVMNLEKAQSVHPLVKMWSNGS